MLVIHEKDNVATALRDLERGAIVRVAGVQGAVEHLQLLEAIRLGHKAALGTIDQGSMVIKHGRPIGRATAPIERGQHVHVHNVESLSVEDEAMEGGAEFMMDRSA